MADALQFIDERLNDSITALSPTVNPVDRLQPLSFTVWLKHNTELFTTTSNYLSRYQSYLNNWYEAKGMTRVQASSEIQQYYTNLINDIVINYTTTDEKRYLKNLDITNNRDLAIAVPFFAKKIKDICLYYSNLRDEIQSTAISYNLKGSNTGIENLLYVSLTKSLQAQDLVDIFASLNLSLSSIRNNMVISVEDLYDTSTEYYDLSPTLPASAYNVNSDLRSETFSLNQVDIDPYLFIDGDQSILKSILSYPFYLIELGENFSIDPLVSADQLNLLKDSDFITTVNDNTVENLNLNNDAQQIRKFIGTDFYYIVTDTTTAYTSGQLFAADSEFANSLNKRYPSIAAVPSQEFLKTGREIGLFFKPDKIGLLNFTNFKFTSNVDISNLQPDTVYYFPDPVKYGNISGNTKLEFQSPLTFFEENYFNKIDFSNQYRAGDVATDPYFQTFRAYQSREQTLNYTNNGVSRYVDSQDFFTGSIDTLWNNTDVYPLISVSQYPIDNRSQALLPLNKTLFKNRNDIYGNNYGLYKETFNKKTLSDPKKQSIGVNYVFDGYVFLDPQPPQGWGQGYNFDYNTTGTTPDGRIFTGIILNTSVSTPASFEDGGSPFFIVSYSFKDNDLYQDLFEFYDTTTYTCNIKDALAFVKPDNLPLPDVSSDNNLTFDPSLNKLYYAELADGAFSPLAPYSVADSTYRGDFTVTVPDDIVVEYDGDVFWVESVNAEPCSLDNYDYTYTERSNFRDLRIDGKETILDFTKLSAPTGTDVLYDTRNVRYGDLYFRNSNSTIIGPVSSTLASVFVNYPNNVKEEVYNKLIDFDMFYDILQLETENYLIFDKIRYDYDNNQAVGSVREFQNFYRGNYPELEKFSTLWFDEKQKTITFCKTTLLPDKLSASNYKIIYPEIYRFSLNDQQITQIYPTKALNALTFNDLSIYSLMGKDIELNIVEIEKPVLNFSNETGYYTLTYLAKDTADCFYIITIRFKYINNTVQDITATMHKPATDVYNITFTTSQGSPYFETYTTLGSAAGYFDSSDNTFTFGYGGRQI
jgi:hypothetical protein